MNRHAHHPFLPPRPGSAPGERAAAEFLRCAPENALVLTHERPDGDALGSVVAMHLLLRALGWNSAALIQGPPARRYRLLGVENIPGVYFSPDHVPQTDCRRIVVLDAGTWERTFRPDWVKGLANLPVLNLDHHFDNPRFGTVSWVDPSAAATAILVRRLSAALGAPLSAEIGTWLLVGVLMDTGGFRFQNTTADVFRETALLLETRADYPRIVDALFFREPYARKLLEAQLLQEARFACDGRLVYAVLPGGRLKKMGLSGADAEGVIDILRAFDGPTIACLFQPGANDEIRISLRSRSEAAPAHKIARELGGGGHPLAAGAKTAGRSLDKVIADVIQLAEKVFGQK